MTDELENPITLSEMEELVLKHQEEGLHKIRTKGQIETANQLRELARSDIADLMYEDEEGNLRMHKLSDLPPEITRTIKKIKFKQENTRGKRIYDSDGNASGGDDSVTTGILEVEFWDKMGALDKLMRHYGGFEQDNKQKVDPLSRKLDSLLTSISDTGLPKLTHDPYADDEVDPYDEVYNEEEEDI